MPAQPQRVLRQMLSQRSFTVWHEQLGGRGSALVRRLLSTPTTQQELRYPGALWAELGEAWPVVRSLCIADSTSDPVQPGPGMFLHWLQRRWR